MRTVSLLVLVSFLSVPALARAQDDDTQGLGAAAFKTAAQKVIQAGMKAMKTCQETAVKKHPKVAGKVTVGWLVDARGVVSDAKVLSSSTHDKALDACAVKEVGGWRFPVRQVPAGIAPMMAMRTTITFAKPKPKKDATKKGKKGAGAAKPSGASR